ncbi:MAG: hypothetical protein C0404_08125 [Verrucomicrobia bacterium]|nr:hypothetical protein [Verrucomicrobiota bacterium]
MTSSQQMIETASKCRTIMEADALESIGGFIMSRQAPDGGFMGKSEASDLYYTVFAIEALASLGWKIPVEALERYLARFGTGNGLDLPHLSCLARVAARLAGGEPAGRKEIAARLEQYRSRDGGYAQVPGTDQGEAYACFLAGIAYEDLGLSIPKQLKALRSITRLELPSGGYAGSGASGVAATTTTASAAVIRAVIHLPVSKKTTEWLLNRYDPSGGGFRATEEAPLPDLLSTATALFALSRLMIPLDSVRQGCANFVQSLWDDNGGFRGHAADSVPDCEYTFYALLALGCLG